MSFMPAFKIGLWNAWILTCIVFLYVFLSGQVSKNVGKKIAHGEEEKKLSAYVAASFSVLVIYSIFLPLKLGTTWFYIGLSIYLLGMILDTITLVNVAHTKLGEPFTTGAYRYSRHPLSLGMMLIFTGIGIASASWLFLLISAILMVITHFMIIIEERSCLKKFGDAYRAYMIRTPRWFGLPKSEKRD